MQQRAQLLVEQFRASLGQANAAQAEHRIGLGGQWQVVQLLVAADVDGADDHRLVAHGIEHRLIGVVLFLFVRRGVAVDEEKLGAQQADAVGAIGQRVCRFRAGCHIGGDLDAQAIGGQCGGVRLGLLFGPALLLLLLQLAHVGQALCAGCQFEAAAVGVQHHRLPLLLIEQRRTQRHHARQALAPGQNRHVGGRATFGHAQSGDALLAQLQ
ncbi:hypothetical protein D9M69_389750 [compost metagenome]